MKKIAIVAVMAIAVASFTACGNNAKKGGLKTDIDSLSYAIGMEQSQGVERYLQQQGIDSTYINEFIKGLEDATKNADNKKKIAYYMGLSAGAQFNQMKENINHTLFGEDSTQTINMKQLVAGFKAGAKGKGGLMTIEQARMAEQLLVQKIQAASAEKNYGPNKKKSEQKMAAIAKNPEYKKLGKGVYYKVVKAGTGAIPTAQQTVKIEYTGKTVDGKVFDSTDKHGGQPVPMPVSGVIPGFTEALTHMPVGSTWEVWIPADAAYGAREMGNDIKPFSALNFTITLVGIEESPKPGVAPAPQPQVKPAK